MDSFVLPQEFSCTLIENNLIIPNNYSISLFIEPIFPVTNNIDIGFRKLKHFFNNKLRNSIFINKDNILLNSFTDIENNLVILPAEPYDFYVASIILAKTKTITKDYFDIYQISLDSTFGEHIKYSVEDPIESGLNIDGDFWWNHDHDGTGHGESNCWDSLQIRSRFQPKIIKGGLSEDK
jgi:hypothetical protein